MTDGSWNLAQLNVGRLLAPLESETLAGFVAALEPINALADGHPGFVWRLQTDAGDATSIRPTEDDLFLINMSVWSSLETLRAFVYTTAHVQVLRQRRAWFEQLATSHMVLWWVPAGHIPTVQRGAREAGAPSTRRPDARRVHVPCPIRAAGERPRRPAGRRRVLLPDRRRDLSAAHGYRPGCQSGSGTPRSWFSKRAMTKSASDRRFR